MAALFTVLIFAGCAKPAMQQEMPSAQITPEAIQVLELTAAKAQKGVQPVAGPLAAALVKVTPTPMPTPTPSPTPSPTPTPAPTPTPVPTPDFEGFVEIGDGGDRGYVKGHDINVRNGPGTQYSKIGELNYLTELRITGKTELWYRVKTDELEGYVLKELIGVGKIPEETPTPKATAKPKATPKPEATKKPTATEEPALTAEPEIPTGTAGNYSSDEIYIAAKCLYSEGKSQSTESLLAMANVLLNRVESSKWPDTISGNVYKNGQFSMPTKNREAFDALTPSDATVSAAERIFNGGERVLPAGVEFFKAARSGTSWGSHTFYKTIGGNNYFYR